MNMFEARDSLLRRATALADHYDADQGEAAAKAAQVVGGGGLAEKMYAFGYLSALALESAELHAGDCTSSCRMCELFGCMVSVMLAMTRQEINRELANKLNT